MSCSIKDRLQAKLLESGSAVVSRPMDWSALGVPEWLADRAERLGFMFPTGVRRMAGFSRIGQACISWMLEFC